MRRFLAKRPDGRLWRSGERGDARWESPTARRLRSLVALVAPVALLTALLFLGGTVFPLVVGLLVLELLVPLLPIQRVRWNAETLTLEGPCAATLSWDAVSSIQLDDDGSFRFSTSSGPLIVEAPPGQSERAALLACWQARRTGVPPALPEVAPRWTSGVQSQSTRVGFHERPAARGYADGPLRPATWLGLAWLLTVTLFPVAEVQDPIAAALVFLATVLSGIATLVVGAVAVLRSSRTGEITVDQHNLVLAPVGGTKRRFPWDGIELLEHDDLELRVKFDGTTTVYDLSSLPPAEVRGLLGELEERWRARRDGADPQADRDALTRLRQRATERR